MIAELISSCTRSKRYIILQLLLNICLAGSILSQQTYMVTTIAGTGVGGYKDGEADMAEFFHPYGICNDGKGNLYVTDYFNHRIRKIAPDGKVSTLAGSGKYGYRDDQGLKAEFYGPIYIIADTQGMLFISDAYNHVIRKITPEGIVSTFAGSGKSGFRDGVGKESQFHSPRGLAFDKNDNLYVADWNNKAIRKISPNGVVTTIAGYNDGYCGGVAVDSSGCIYISSYFSNRIWKMNTQGKFNIFAGSGIQGVEDGGPLHSKFYHPYNLTIDKNQNIYVVDEQGQTIRKISPNAITQTVAGTPNDPGYLDGLATLAQFAEPTGISIDNNTLSIYIADFSNHRIRKITPILRPQEPILKIVAQTCSTYTIQVQAATQQVIEGIQLIAANSNNVELELLSSLPATTVFIVVRLKDRTSRGNFRLMATATGNLSAALSGTFELQPSLSIASPLHNQTFRVPSTPSMMCTTLTVRNPSAMAMNINTAYTLNNTSFSLVPSQFPVFVPPLSTANLKICFAPPKPGEYQDTVVIPTGDCGALHIPLVATGLINLFAIDSSRCLIAGNSLNTANISLYPNPVIDQCTILLQHRNPEYHQNLQVPYIVSNILGQTVLQGELALFTVNNEPMLYQAHIEVQTIPPGYYYVTISGVQTFGRIPFVIQR